MSPSPGIFRISGCLHLEQTRPNVADVNPTQANAC